MTLQYIRNVITEILIVTFHLKMYFGYSCDVILTSKLWPLDRILKPENCKFATVINVCFSLNTIKYQQKQNTPATKSRTPARGKPSLRAKQHFPACSVHIVETPDKFRTLKSGSRLRISRRPSEPSPCIIQTFDVVSHLIKRCFVARSRRNRAASPVGRLVRELHRMQIKHAVYPRCASGIAD